MVNFGEGKVGNWGAPIDKIVLFSRWSMLGTLWPMREKNEQIANDIIRGGHSILKRNSPNNHILSAVKWIILP